MDLASLLQTVESPQLPPTVAAPSSSVGGGTDDGENNMPSSQKEDEKPMSSTLQPEGQQGLLDTTLDAAEEVGQHGDCNLPSNDGPSNTAPLYQAEEDDQQQPPLPTTAGTISTRIAEAETAEEPIAVTFAEEIHGSGPPATAPVAVAEEETSPVTSSQTTFVTSVSLAPVVGEERQSAQPETAIGESPSPPPTVVSPAAAEVVEPVAMAEPPLSAAEIQRRVTELMQAGDLRGAEKMLKMLKKQRKMAEKSSDAAAEGSSHTATDEGSSPKAKKEKKEKKEKRSEARDEKTEVEGATTAAGVAANKPVKTGDSKGRAKKGKETTAAAPPPVAEPGSPTTPMMPADATQDLAAGDTTPTTEGKSIAEEALATLSSNSASKADRKPGPQAAPSSSTAASSASKKKSPAAAITSKPLITPVKSLSAFGFKSEKRTAEESDKKLFGVFVPDKRLVPARLRFWETKQTTDRQVDFQEDGEGLEAKRATEASSSSCFRTVDSLQVRSSCPQGFNRSAVFVGYFAVGNDPCQARPPYFGTVNSNLTDEEVLSFARFPLNAAMPRSSMLDYQYDSGDDWDHVDSDDDVGDSDDEDDENGGDSDGGSSSDSFIDDDSCGDSDGDNANRVLDARRRRQNRLRGKDRLVPAFSGPFADTPQAEHPLRTLDSMRALLPCGPASFNAMLMQLLRRTDLIEQEPQQPSKQAAAAAAVGARAAPSHQTVLRYRPIGNDELDALHQYVKENAEAPFQSVHTALIGKQLFAGVAQSQLRRVMIKYYERSKRGLIRRLEPLADDDPKLAPEKKKATKKTTVEAAGGSSSPDKREREGTEADDDDAAATAAEAGSEVVAVAASLPSSPFAESPTAAENDGSPNGTHYEQEAVDQEQQQVVPLSQEKRGEDRDTSRYSGLLPA